MRVQIEILCAERKAFYCLVGQAPDVWQYWLRLLPILHTYPRSVRAST